MKKIIYYLLFATCVLCSCEKEDIEPASCSCEKNSIESESNKEQTGQQEQIIKEIISYNSDGTISYKDLYDNKERLIRREMYLYENGKKYLFLLYIYTYIDTKEGYTATYTTTTYDSKGNVTSSDTSKSEYIYW